MEKEKKAVRLQQLHPPFARQLDVQSMVDGGDDLDDHNVVDLDDYEDDDLDAHDDKVDHEDDEQDCNEPDGQID